MLNELYFNYCKQLKQTNRYRVLYKLPNCFNLDFSTNDYLLFSKNPDIRSAAYQAAEQYGVGATGSRLLSGNQQIFSELEQLIAEDKGAQSCIVFNSGFQANITVLSSLLDYKVLGDIPVVFFDRLNHASLYQAIFLSKVHLVRYRHNDMQHLADLLEKFANSKLKFIVTETIFGMDGDVLLIDKLLQLARQYQALVYLDEAHATGVIGNQGYGLAAKQDFTGINYVIMGTFSKALGSCGAYIATSAIIKDYLVNKAPGLIYSTALSPMIVGAVVKAWQMVKSLAKFREQLFINADYLRQNLQSLGFNTGLSGSHIIPIILNKEDLAISWKEKLLKHDILVSSVRPPTVPYNSARIRLALHIGHTKKDLDLLLNIIDGL